MSAPFLVATQAAFGVKTAWKREKTVAVDVMLLLMLLLTADSVSSCITAVRWMHPDPRVNILNWQWDQQLLNDLTKTLTQGRLLLKGGKYMRAARVDAEFMVVTHKAWNLQWQLNGFILYAAPFKQRPLSAQAPSSLSDDFCKVRLVHHGDSGHNRLPLCCRE